MALLVLREWMVPLGQLGLKESKAQPGPQVPMEPMGRLVIKEPWAQLAIRAFRVQLDLLAQAARPDLRGPQEPRGLTVPMARTALESTAPRQQPAASPTAPGFQDQSLSMQTRASK